MNFQKPTDKQTAYVERIIAFMGERKVQDYIQHFFSDAELDDLTKDQAQRIIQGFQSYLPRKNWGGNGMPMSWIQSQ